MERKKGASVIFSEGLAEEPCLYQNTHGGGGRSNLPGRTSFQRAEAATEKGHFQGPDRWHSLIDETQSVPASPD